MFTAFKRLLFGNPLKTHQVVHERLTKKPALAVFSSDALPYHLENKIVGASPPWPPRIKGFRGRSLLEQFNSSAGRTEGYPNTPLRLFYKLFTPSLYPRSYSQVVDNLSAEVSRKVRNERLTRGNQSSGNGTGRIVESVSALLRRTLLGPSPSANLAGKKGRDNAAIVPRTRRHRASTSFFV